MPRTTLPLDQLTQDAQEAYQITQQASDIACALVLAGFVDQCLGTLLERNLVPSSLTTQILDPRGGFLGSLEARARLAYCLGLIPKQLYQNVDYVAQVRNVFAHRHLDIKFEQQSIQSICDLLVLPHFEFVTEKDKDPEAIRAHFMSLINTPRMKYVMNCVFMADRLILIARAAQQPEPSSLPWADSAA